MRETSGAKFRSTPARNGRGIEGVCIRRRRRVESPPSKNTNTFDTTRTPAAPERMIGINRLIGENMSVTQASGRAAKGWRVPSLERGEGSRARTVKTDSRVTEEVIHGLSRTRLASRPRGNSEKPPRTSCPEVVTKGTRR